MIVSMLVGLYLLGFGILWAISILQNHMKDEIQYGLSKVNLVFNEKAKKDLETNMTIQQLEALVQTQSTMIDKLKDEIKGYKNLREAYAEAVDSNDRLSRISRNIRE